VTVTTHDVTVYGVLMNQFVAVVVCGRHSLPCGRHGHVVWPSWFVAVMVYVVAVIDVAVIVCGRHGLAVIVYLVAVMDNGHVLWPSWFVAVIDLAVMVCGRHGTGSKVARSEPANPEFNAK